MKKVEEMNIYEKLSAITTEIEHVQKNLSVSAGGGSYKAVGEADILKAVKPLEDSYRVYSFPLTRTVIESGTLEQKEGKKQLFMREKVIYRFINIDKPEEFIDQESIGDGVDPQDKAPGKAATYADKYALMKAYKIQTGDDPDQYGSEELESKKTTTIIEKRTDKKSKYAQVLDLIKGTDISFDKALLWIAKRFGDGKRVNDLTDEEFSELVEAVKHPKNA